MNKLVWGFLIITLSSIPSVSFAKGAPLFFQTGDELFEIKGAPALEDGYTIGYACKRFGLFGADIWTWDCDLMAVNLDKFSAGDLDPEYKAELQTQYSLSDRSRDPWNHFGAIGIALLLLGGVVIKSRS